MKNKLDYSEKIIFPLFFEDALAERVIFAGNLTRYFEEIKELLETDGTLAFLRDGVWEMPQLVGFDLNGKVVLLVFRNSSGDAIGENEFLVASEDSRYVQHINTFELEDSFFQHCFQIIALNINTVRWEIFKYDENHNYIGQMLIDELQEELPQKVISLTRSVDESDVI